MLFLRLGAGCLDKRPEFGIVLQGSVFCDGQVGAKKKVFEGVLAKDAMHDNPEVVLLEVDAVIAEAETVQDLAVTLQLAKALKFSGHDFVGQAAEFAEDVQLQFPWHARQFGRAGRIENNLEWAHAEKNLLGDAARKKLKIGCVDTIMISELEVRYRVGVPDEERRQAQRLLLTVEMRTDFSEAIRSDSIDKTIDYFAVSEALLTFGEGKEWKLIEKLAADIAEMTLTNFGAASATVEVKKFVVPEAQYVAVRLTRGRV